MGQKQERARPHDRRDGLGVQRFEGQIPQKHAGQRTRNEPTQQRFVNVFAIGAQTQDVEHQQNGHQNRRSRGHAHRHGHQWHGHGAKARRKAALAQAQ